MARDPRPHPQPSPVVAQARNAALVLFEVSRGNQRASGQQLVGYSVSLAFFSLYVRMRQAPKPAPKPKAE